MGVVHISFELWCGWHTTAPSYRVYVNDNLLTERTYNFNNSEIYLEEHIPLLTTAGAHFLKIINLDPVYGEFVVKNFKVNNKIRDYREHDCRFVLNQDDLKV